MPLLLGRTSPPTQALTLSRGRTLWDKITVSLSQEEIFYIAADMSKKYNLNEDQSR